MKTLREMLSGLADFWPALVVVVSLILLLALANWLLRRRAMRSGADSGFPRQLVTLAISALGLVVMVLAIPVTEERRGELFTLLGLAVTAIVALSSTTFVSNVMAGMMLRSVRNFRPGDFIRVAGHVGRVTERGLFHTEIQTEDRDLTTIPNLFLVSQPMTVVRSSGTIVSATVSLGYDEPQSKLETLFVEAARQADLTDAFVQVIELGDFSVTYRIAGFLADVKTLLTVRSMLRARILDVLHGAGVEIVSPGFMIQRPQREGTRVLPPLDPTKVCEVDRLEAAPETRIFDKAEQAEDLVKMRSEYVRVVEENKGLEASRHGLGEDDRARLERRIEQGRGRATRLKGAIERAEAATAADPDES